MPARASDAPINFKKDPPLDLIEGLGQARGELVADELVEIGAVLFRERPPELRSVARFHR